MLDGPAAGFLSVGQEAPRGIALRAMQGGRLHRTLLIHGPRGAGADRFVEDLLALLLCTADASARPCNRCVGCRGARARSHPDLVLGSPARWRDMKASDESAVAAARRWLGESAGAPVAGDRRIVLLEEIDAASERIQNALLKALEEPGPRQMFVLVADDPARLLPTIRSRCQPLRISRVPRAELAAWLMEHEQLPAEIADDLARLSGGLSGLAIDMARRPDFTAWRRQAQRGLLDLLARGPADRFSALRDLLDEAAPLAPDAPSPFDPATDGRDPPARTPAATQRAAALLLVDAWRGLARDLLLVAAGRPELAVEVLDGAPAAAERVGRAALAGFLRTLDRVQDSLLVNAAPKLATEVAMLAWPRLPVPTGR